MPIITASKMSMILSLFRSAYEFQSGCPGSVPKAAEKTMASYMSVFPSKFRSPNGVGTMSQYPFCVLCGIASAPGAPSLASKSVGLMRVLAFLNLSAGI